MMDENELKINPIKNLVGEKLLGYTGKNTTTFMSYEAVQEFYNWITTKCLTNDKHINWLLKGIRMVETPQLVKNRVQPIQNKAATYSLGETDAFKKLQEKFK